MGDHIGINNGIHLLVYYIPDHKAVHALESYHKYLLQLENYETLVLPLKELFYA